VTTLDASRGETAHRYPFLLPDGRHFLYLALNVSGNSRDPANRIWVGSLDKAQAKPLIPANFNAQYALETSGEPVTVADQISLYLSYIGFGAYSVSRGGTLVFDAFRLLTRLEWFDRAGKRTGGFGDAGPHFNPRISPDGTRIAFDEYDTRTQTTQIWIGDVSRGVQTRLTSIPGSNSGAVWSPDGSASRSNRTASTRRMSTCGPSRARMLMRRSPTRATSAFRSTGPAMAGS